MYNPNRNNKGHKARRSALHGGKKRSDFVSTAGASVSSEVEKVKTEKGYLGRLFTCKDYEVTYRLLQAQNSTDFGFHSSKDRTIHVLSGSVFVKVETEEGEGKFERLFKGAHYNFPKGLKYSISANEDSELLVVNVPGYDGTFKVIDAGVTNSNNQEVAFSAPITAEPVAEVAAPPHRRQRQNKPPIKAERVKSEKKTKYNPVSTGAIGVNLPPVIPTPEE